MKNSKEKLRKRVENGLRVKGTGIGQRVKGKESERSMKGRYVWIFTLNWNTFGRRRRLRCAVESRMGLLGRVYADLLCVLQIGEEEKGYVGDAADDPDMETGKLLSPLRLILGGY